MLAWCGWLLCSWAINWMIDGPVFTSNDNMLPVVRWMMMSAMLGMTLIWPACRLTWCCETKPAARAWWDFVCLMLVLQVVVWPLRLLVNWSNAQVWWINIVVAAWSLLITLWVYLGLHNNHRGRTLAMIVCVLTLMVPVVIQRTSGVPCHDPFTMLWIICEPRLSELPHDVMVNLVAIIALATAGWVFALFTVKNRDVSSPPDASPPTKADPNASTRYDSSTQDSQTF